MLQVTNDLWLLLEYLLKHTDDHCQPPLLQYKKILIIIFNKYEMINN